MDQGAIQRRARILFAITVALIVLAAGIWYLVEQRRNVVYQLFTHDNVSGLGRDSPVEFHGVQVGKVTGVQLTGPATVRVVIEVDRDTPVSSATRAAITSRGLTPKGFTGYVAVELDDVSNDVRPLASGPEAALPTIPTISSRDISLDTEISQASELIHGLLDQSTVKSLQQSVASMQHITSALADNNARLRSLIANSERASKELGPLLQSSGDSLDALQNQVLPQAYKALSDLEGLANTLNGTASEISRDPSILLRGRARPAPAPGEGK